MEYKTLDDLLKAYGAPVFEMSSTVNEITIDIKMFMADDGSLAFYQNPQIEECDITNTLATIILELLLERGKEVSRDGLILHLKSRRRAAKKIAIESRLEFYEEMIDKMIDDLEALQESK